MTDEESRALAVKTVAAVFMTIATISVMLRCYVRGWLVKAFGWDDGSMVLAAVIYSFRWSGNDMLMIQVFYVMFSACMIGGTLYGTGYHFANLEPENRVTAMEVRSFPQSSSRMNAAHVSRTVLVVL